MQMFDSLRKINNNYAVNSQNHIIDILTGQDTGQILTSANYQAILNGTFSPYQMVTAPNFIMLDDTPSVNAGAGAGAGGGKSNPGKIAGMFANLRNRFGKDKPLFSGDFKLPNLGKLAKDVRQTKIIEGGPTIGGAANTLSGLYQGGTALKGLYDNMNLEDDLSSLKEDVNLSIASNPMYDTYLDAADEKIIRQMNNGTLENNWGNAVSGAIKGIPKAAISAMLGGLTGGIGGAAIGGLGSLANSAISGYGKGTEEASNKLQSLYSKLRQSNEEYRSMKRPSGLHRAGLQTRYFNQLY